eukprot:m.216181 g.216181  ORF g.216181 m.216181 type:complete len:73 (+) comp39853_c0_seq1:1525-1743(+)
MRNEEVVTGIAVLFVLLSSVELLVQWPASEYTVHVVAVKENFKFHTQKSQHCLLLMMVKIRFISFCRLFPSS